MVAPRVGAWIETLSLSLSPLYSLSHPVWVRGLKLTQAQADSERARSHPVWVRGLKHQREDQTYNQDNVAPRVGAWIETWCH